VSSKPPKIFGKVILMEIPPWNQMIAGDIILIIHSTPNNTQLSFIRLKSVKKRCSHDVHSLYRNLMFVSVDSATTKTGGRGQPTPPHLRTARLLGLLEEQNLLSSDVSELMTSMRHYAEKQRLPMMRTYNGDF